MKKMFLTASVVGAAVAGLVVYLQKRNSPQGKLKAAAKDAYHTMNDGIGSVERLGTHSMG